MINACSVASIFEGGEENPALQLDRQWSSLFRLFFLTFYFSTMQQEVKTTYAYNSCKLSKGEFSKKPHTIEINVHLIMIFLINKAE